MPVVLTTFYAFYIDRIGVFDILVEKYSMTSIMISHNMKDPIDYSDIIVMLDKGRVVLDKANKDIIEKELIEIYRKNLEFGTKSA
ncbi:hypothetical protein [Garciella nitratireducens]|uniref:hypothetical protein n=1 Tax=Garciella nitratireducens TaxID=218205 RepID=UPI0011BF2E1A|nr:hypothetical protein [Garciella nitratireducens]